VEILVVFLVRVSDHIEVAKEQPRNVGSGGDGPDFLQERSPHVWGRGSINICNYYREIRASRGEVSGKSVWGGGVSIGTEN
jgi:hypothetical protein